MIENKSKTAFQLTETFLNIIRKDEDYGISLLEGEKLIFFPA